MNVNSRLPMGLIGPYIIYRNIYIYIQFGELCTVV